MQKIKECIREKILAVAKHEFSSKGYKKVSMRCISSKCGMGVGNLYHYFPGKKSLFDEVARPAEAILKKISESREIDSFWKLVNENRSELRIFLFKGYQSFPDYIRNVNNVPDGLLSFVGNIWLYNLMKELLTHKLKKEVINKLISDYLNFSNNIIS